MFTLAWLGSSISHCSLHQVQVDDWGHVLSQLFPPNTVGHPAQGSSSPDILLNLPTAIIGFQAKQFNRTKLKWKEIQEEINKTAPLNKVKRVCLVMVALKLGKSIEKVLGTSAALTLQSGYWWLDEGWLMCTQDHSPPQPLSQRLFKQGKKQPEKATLTIPQNMELVILGEEGVNQLLGKANVETLSKLMKDRANITTFSHLFLPMVPESDGRQRSKRKHAPRARSRPVLNTVLPHGLNIQLLSKQRKCLTQVKRDKQGRQSEAAL